MAEPGDDRTQFLSTLWPSIPEGHWLLYWGAPSKLSEWSQTIDFQVSTWAVKENVYLGCSTRLKPLGPTMRGKREECAAIPGLWLDIDYGPEHKKPNLPQTEEEAMSLITSMGVPPTMVVHSGRGLQAWWCFREPWIFSSDEDRDAAERLTKAWCATLRARCHEKGWDADQVGDLPRVMRIPGTWNRKGIPLPTRLISCDDTIRYNPSDFDGLLSSEPKESTNRPTMEWKFDLNPNAEPPASKFMILGEIDSSFKLGWMEKLGLQDKSPSSFDLSQATRAFAADWTPQEIVNLLIARRRLHKHDLKLRKDYYERTLTLAASGKSGEERRQIAEGVKAGNAVPDEVKKDPAEVLGICSEIIGVEISKFVRFKGEPNTYQLTMKGHIVDVPCIDQLESQSQFRKLVLDHTDHRFMMKQDQWGPFVNLFFSAIENVQLSADATMRGSYENWIELYLAKGVSSDREWQSCALMGNPFVKDGKTYIVSEGFRQYLWGSQQEKVSSRQLTASLTKCGYRNEHLNFRFQNKQNKRSVWAVTS